MVTITPNHLIFWERFCFQFPLRYFFKKVSLSVRIVVESSIHDINGKLTIRNHPNPFNPSTEIVFTLPEEEYVRLNIYDVRGREVERLVDGLRAEGVHSVIWNGSGYSSGVYFYHLRAGNRTLRGKMLLLK